MKITVKQLDASFMRFYDRQNELAYLLKQEKRSITNAQMTLVIGRRRIGKTSLIKKSIEGKKALYFFIAKKSETLLVQEFSELIRSSFAISWYGELKSFKDIFALLMDHAEKENFTLVLDEFQEFMSINPSIFSDMQHIWDSKKDSAKINLLICGSIYSIMKKIFEDKREPLFGRITGKIHLKPFGTETIKEILRENYPNFTQQDLLAFFTLTGGVAKYIETFVVNNSLKQEEMLQEIFNSNSTLLDEGRNVLIEEFGRDHHTYFSILSLIASSKTSRPEIESILESSVGVYLERLEKEFGIIKRITPIFSKSGNRRIKYRIEDNFLNFWFRFIYKYRSIVELENYQMMLDIVTRDFATFSGSALEKYFLQQLKENQLFTTIGTYWEKTNENEIDIVAINEFEKKLLIGEVKLNKAKYNEAVLIRKASKLTRQYTDYTITYRCFSPEDM